MKICKLSLYEQGIKVANSKILNNISSSKESKTVLMKSASVTHDIYDEKQYQAYIKKDWRKHSYYRGVAMAFGTFAHTGKLYGPKKLK